MSNNENTIGRPNWDLSKLSTPPAIYPAPNFERPGVESLFFENEPYKKKSTRVFAYLGLPYMDNTAETAGCPGMVLLHGGGGTAFDEWVRIWNRRGYAAIAFDQCGCVPERPKSVDGTPHERHEHGGPAGWTASFEHVDEEVEDQWQYHAVAAALRAHSLLASMPGVDPDRIGVTGISWGGYLSGLVAAADPRLRCAVPVYGCGFLGDDSKWKDTVFLDLKPGDAGKWLELCDPAHYLPQTKIPFCWVSGTNDFAYPLNSLQKSYRVTGGNRTVCIRVEMPHSHTDGWAPAEIRVFADSILNGGPPLIRVIESGLKDHRLTAIFESVRPVMNAEINYTRATGCWNDRKFRTLPAEIAGIENSGDLTAGRSGSIRGRVTAEIPPRTTACFLNLFDDRNCVVSTEHIELDPQLGPEN